MELINKNVNIDFLGKRKQAMIVSASLILIGLISLIIHGGPNLGIEFKGGTQVQLKFATAESIGDIRDALGSANLGNSEIKGLDNQEDILITTEQQEDIALVSENIATALRERFPSNTISIERIEAVGPKIGSELVANTLKAIGLALIFLVIYVSWRFEFKFALGAVSALVHDVIITVGLFSLLNREITLAIVAALLTIVGYSLNDTIVVSDRIRENLKLMRKEKFFDIINRSLNQTLSRTIITSLTTLIVVLILFIWGGEIIRDFALALIIGISIGTYSSIFVATPIVVKYHDWQESKKVRK
ncbi:MAG: protein translocase subunit SecF [bacterium]|nr:protein translocase subunit SecF [bacterium]